MAAQSPPCAARWLGEISRLRPANSNSTLTKEIGEEDRPRSVTVPSASTGTASLQSATSSTLRPSMVTSQEPVTWALALGTMNNERRNNATADMARVILRLVVL